MHDSGDRDKFNSGAVRDNGEKKPRPDLISPFSKFRLGEWLRKGAEKYSARNWEKGIPISREIEAIERHLAQYQMGMTNEDHMAAIMCNAMFILHYEEMIKMGVLPASLDDRPKYVPMPVPVYGASVLCRNDSEEMIRKGDAVYYTEKLDGARLPFAKKIADAADRFANLRKRVNDAQVALMKELDGEQWTDQLNTDNTDKGYELELKGLNPITINGAKPYTGKPSNGGPLVMPKVSGITGQSMSKTVPGMIDKVQKAFILPDDNQMQTARCDICGTKKNLRFYRTDLKRHYCSDCYHNNRIDLKPVIRS